MIQLPIFLCMLIVVILTAVNGLALVVTGVVAFLRWVGDVPPIDKKRFSFNGVINYIDDDVLKGLLKDQNQKTKRGDS